MQKIQRVETAKGALIGTINAIANDFELDPLEMEAILNGVLLQVQSNVRLQLLQEIQDSAQADTEGDK